MKKSIITIFTAMLAFAACSNKEEIILRNEVKIATSVNELTSVTHSRANIDPRTGAGNLENGDVILLEYSSSDGRGFGDSYKLGETQIYWDQLIAFGGNPPFKFGAYYPLNKGLLINNYNAATATNPDLLYGSATGVNEGEQVNLLFNHIMHKLEINLSSNFYNASQLANATVTLQNLKSTAFIFNGRVILASASGADLYPNQTGTNTSFIVAPQNITENTEMINIQIDGNTFIYNVPSGLTSLDSGKKLTLNLNIKYTGTSIYASADVETKNIEVRSWNNTEDMDFQVSGMPVSE